MKVNGGNYMVCWGKLKSRGEGFTGVPSKRELRELEKHSPRSEFLKT